MIFKLIHPTSGTTLGVFTTRSAAKREAARAQFPTEIVEVEAMAPREAVREGKCDLMGCGKVATWVYHKPGSAFAAFQLCDGCVGKDPRGKEARPISRA